jgi:peptidoglycan/xylan/chitin deacetylase (PgdA/CDA1 family)
VEEVQHMKRVSNGNRREFLAAAAGVGIAGWASSARAAESDRALVAITLDLEMSRNFPTWSDTHWDYEKGNLDEATKAYAVEACRRVKAAGGVIHCFAVGRVFEQENVDWLKEIVQAGHPVGNHTYDHVNVTATKLPDVQFRFQRAPWLVEGRTPAEVIRENISLCTAALKSRLGIAPAGFRTPGGFADGLRARPDVRQTLRDQGFDWVSSLSPRYKMSPPQERPGADIYDAIVAAQTAAQPFVYPDGLVEVPMSPISDIGAFRNGRWPLESFLEATRRSVAWAIENRAVFDLLGHPSCLAVTDPEFRAVELICTLVRKSGDRAMIVGLDTIAQRARSRSEAPGG